MNNSLYSLKKVQFRSDQFKLNINKFEIHRGAIYMISGGISSIDDVIKIKKNNYPNIEGVIIGKAIYDGNIDIKELRKIN